VQVEARACNDWRVTIRIPLAGGGTTWARVVEGPAHAPAVVLAPGAGSDRTNPLLAALQDALVAAGFTAVAFDFPYRTAGRRVPDRAPVLESCWRSVLAWVRATLEPRWIAAGGRSMGGRMASHVAAAGEPLRGLVFLGFPLHPSGHPGVERAAHLARIGAPMLFVQGTRDALAQRDLLAGVLAGLPQAMLHEIAEADHGFRVANRTGRTAADVTHEITDTVTTWFRQLEE
jgi:predicted alpha/beta-hydrolase family hydrolase